MVIFYNSNFYWGKKIYICIYMYVHIYMLIYIYTYTHQILPFQPFLSLKSLSTFSTIHLQNFFILLNNNSFHTFPSPRNHRSVFCLNLTTPSISYKWNCTIFVLLCLDYYTEHNVFKFQQCCGMC